MTEKTPTPALNAALAKVQAKLPKLERDRTVEVQQKNGGTYKYSYATLANLSEAVLPLLAANGLAFTAMPGTGADGKMCVRYSLMHESGEALTGEFPISGEGGIQMIGGRITYIRRYCLAAVVGIAADEDDETRLADDTAPRTAQRARRPAPRQSGGTTVQRSAARQHGTRPPLPGEEQTDGQSVTKAQLTKLHTLFSAIGWNDRDDRLRASSAIVGRELGSSSELTHDEAVDLIDSLDDIASEDDPADKLTERLAALRQAEDGA